MVRTIKKDTYIIAFLITAMIFATGFLIGYLITKPRYAGLEEISYLQSIEQRSLQLELLYIANLKENNESCGIFNSILTSSLDTVRNAQSKLEIYIEQSVSPSDYKNIKREYMLTEINYWLLYDDLTEMCEQDNVAILYFYSNEDCNDCSSQGTILTYLKNKLEDRLLIFSLDSDFVEEPMIGLLKKEYNITGAPSIIINDVAYNGLVKKDEVIDRICALYLSKPGLCYE